MKKILLAIVILSIFLVPAYASEKSISIGFPPGYNESDINIDYVKSIIEAIHNIAISKTND